MLSVASPPSPQGGDRSPRAPGDPTTTPRSGGAKREVENELKSFLKWYLNFGVYKLNKGKFKSGVLQLDYLHGRVGVGKKGHANLQMPFEILDKVTLSEQDPRCFHIHLHDLTPVVLYSQQEEDRPTIVNELRQIINNTEFLKGSTEPPKLNDYAEIIRLGEVEKKGPVKWVTRTLVLTDTQLLCMRDTTRDAFPVNVIDICDILAVEREKEATFKVVTELRTFQFKAATTPKREKWVTKLTATVELQSEMRERALREKKKKQRKQKNESGAPSEIVLPSGIPLLGRYEVHFADLHALFGQNVAKPDNKVINLKTYYDIRHAAALNQVRKEILILSEATGALGFETINDSHANTSAGELRQGEGVTGAEESEDEEEEEDFTTENKKKKGTSMRLRRMKNRTKLIKSSPDLNSALSGSADSKRRFLKRKGARKANKFPSHSDLLSTREIVSAREERDEGEPRTISDKRSWGAERKSSVSGLARNNSEASLLGSPRLLSGHRSQPAAPGSGSHPSPLPHSGLSPKSPPPLPTRPPALPPRPLRSPRALGLKPLPPTPVADGAGVVTAVTPPAGGAGGQVGQKDSLLGGSGERTSSWAKSRMGEGPTAATANAKGNSRRSTTSHRNAQASQPDASTKIGGGRGLVQENGHQRSAKSETTPTTEDEFSSSHDEEDEEEDDEDDSTSDEDCEMEDDDSDDDDDDDDDDDNQNGSKTRPPPISPSSWRKGSHRRSLDLMGGSSGEYSRATMNLGMKDVCVLQTGGIFTKYCRNAKSKNLKGARRQRSVCLSEDLKAILVYRNLDRSLKSKKDCRTISLSQVVDICKGFKTPILMRHGRPGEESMALSIYYTKPHSGDRTLDLVAAAPDIRDMWVQCLQHLLASRRDRI